MAFEIKDLLDALDSVRHDEYSCETRDALLCALAQLTHDGSLSGPDGARLMLLLIEHVRTESSSSSGDRRLVLDWLKCQEKDVPFGVSQENIKRYRGY